MPDNGTTSKEPVPKKHKTREEFTFLHSFGDLNGTVYNPLYTSNTIGSDASVSMVGIKFSNEQKDNLTIRTGSFASWLKGHSYESIGQHYSITSLRGEKTKSLGQDYALNLRGQLTYFSPDLVKGAYPSDTYFNPEARIKHGDYSVGLSAVVGNHIAKDQAYVTAGFKKTQVNVGAYIQPPAGHLPEWRMQPGDEIKFRAAASQGVQFAENQNLKIFGSYEAGAFKPDALAQARLGTTYTIEAKNANRWGDKWKLQAETVLSSTAPHHLAHATGSIDMPFSLSQKDMHAVHGIMSAAGGWVAKKGELQPAFSIGLNVKLFDSKSFSR